MKKKIIITVILSLIFIIFKYLPVPIQLIPYPYKFKTKAKPESAGDILVIGDNLAKNLNPYLKLLSKDLSRKLKNPIILNNISKPNFGIHRAFRQIKAITKIPPLTILILGSQELNERTFNISEYKKIKENLKSYNNEIKNSLIMAMPFFSKFIYKKIKTLELSSQITTPKLSRDMLKQQFLELKFIFFKLTLAEILEYITSRGGKIIIISPVINYNQSIVKTCSNSSQVRLTNYLLKMIQNIDNIDLKVTYRKLKNHLKKYPGNATYYSLLAKISNRLGMNFASKYYAKMSLIFDCSLRNPNPIFKDIEYKLASTKDIDYINFNNFVPEDNGFRNKFIPKDIYIEKMMNDLKKRIKILLKI